ncbi:MAG: hypothetical protein ACK2TZ_00635, partial [Anaerolineales bacterium]
EPAGPGRVVGRVAGAVVEDVIDAGSEEAVDERLQMAQGDVEMLGEPCSRFGGRQLAAHRMGARGGKLGHQRVAVEPKKLRLGDIVQAVEVARKAGRILVFGGLPKGNSTPPVDMNLVHYNALYVIGTTTFAPRHYRQAVQLVSSNKIPVDKLITHRFPLDEFVTGANMALEGKVLKAVFEN